MKKEVFKVGDYLRAYDFKPFIGRGDNFIEGKITAAVKPENDYYYYLVDCTRDIVDDLPNSGKYSRVGNLIKVPMMTQNDYPGRVINLSRI